MSNIQVFESPEFGQVRTTTHNGEIAFVAKDVLERLGYEIDGGIGKYIKHVPDEWKGGTPISTPAGTQEMAVLTEQGLYFFLARSDKPLALPFQKWIAGDVVPSIRKHGGYLTPDKIEEALLNPDTIIKLATSLKEERIKRMQAERQIEVDRPKVVFADAVSVSQTSILVSELAKILCQNGMEIGGKRLFERLRNDGYLCVRGSEWNIPTQRSMELGLFEIKETVVTHSDGHTTINRTPKVTGKGQIYFVNKYLGKNAAYAS